MKDQISIKLKGVNKSFSNGWLGRSKTIKNLNLEIKSKEIFGYVGSNGAGKTTTFKLMLDLIRPDNGEITFWGRPVKDKSVREQIGYLPEHPYFYSHLTAIEALDFYGSLFNIDKPTRKIRIKELLELVNLSHNQNLQLKKFSRGMLQRIGIAQALINDPKLLILDEPMSGLDPMGRKAMRDIILACRDQGKTIIFSSHIISDIEMICDRAGILSKGELLKIVAMDEPINSTDTAWEISCQGGTLDLREFKAIYDIKQVTRGNRNIISTCDKETAEKIITHIKAQGLELISFSIGRKSIEDIYLKASGTKVE